MLVTAGTREKFNTMTASWGGLGFLWNRPVAFVFVRNTRYTYNFTQSQDSMTLSFFDEEYRPALRICGKLSGRDTDKVAAANLTPAFTPEGNPYFVQARMVLECRKLYSHHFDPQEFVDKGLVGQWYAQNDFHRMYVAEIVNCWVSDK